AYLAFEEASGFPFERRRLPKVPKRGRLGVDSWISCGRKLAIHPCLPSCAEIPALFWDYWRSIQPADRLRDKDTLIRSKSMDWSVLRDFLGKNGLLQVVMILLWWGARAHRRDDATGKKDREQVAEWELAVDDVRWAFTAMV
ncbi:hypothetical protein DFH06DRAFT_950396, partial [Mycena polygramma]